MERRRVVENPTVRRSRLHTLPSRALRLRGGLDRDDLGDVIEIESGPPPRGDHVVHLLCAEQAEARLLAEERQRPEPHDRQAGAMQVSRSFFDPPCDRGRHRLVELPHVGLDEKRLPFVGVHPATVRGALTFRVVANPTLCYVSVSWSSPAATRDASSVRERTPAFR